MTSCNCLDVPKSPAGNLVPPVIKPNVEVPTVNPGFVKFVWFRVERIKPHLPDKRSLSRVFFTSATSRFEKPGPINHIAAKDRQTHCLDSPTRSGLEYRSRKSRSHSLPVKSR